MQTLELAREIERRGFAGIYCASFGDGVGLCEALALRTERIPFGTAIANLYMRHVADYAQTASLIHELSGGRFRFGVGVSHQPVHQRMGLRAGKPLADVRRFVADLRAVPRAGELPPLVLAAMRKNMVALGGEIAQGIVFANAARSHMSASLAHLPERAQRDPDFFIGDMIPTVVDDDAQAAAAVNRKTMVGYVSLPNYRNYWKEAGYVEEMEAIEKALGRGEAARLPELMSDRWLRDVTLFGTAREVRDGLEAWFASGVHTPILVPSSTRGGQFQAFDEIFRLFA
jgi:alkanesulfonate monooxygenase SsuD/methylene tetrahydromethanopterin reductase-like flavin-dependent oxidoreductase (luciferase family)